MDHSRQHEIFAHKKIRAGKTVTKDINSDGTIDLTTNSTIVQGTTSRVVTGVTGATTSVVDTANNGGFLDETVTF
jgi:hypothetical protein